MGKQSTLYSHLKVREGIVGWLSDRVSAQHVKGWRGDSVAESTNALERP